MRILVAEDEDMVFRNLNLRLSRHFPAAAVVRAITFAEAKAACERDRFDFIVSDFQFPGEQDSRSGGRDFYRYCRETKQPGRFIFYSGTGPRRILNDIGLPDEAPPIFSKLPEGTESLFAFIREQMTSGSVEPERGAPIKSDGPLPQSKP